MNETTLAGHAFFEDVADQLVNSFEGSAAPRSLRIVNGAAAVARGMGFTVARRFGDAMRGSVRYIYGHTWRNDRPLDLVLGDRRRRGCSRTATLASTTWWPGSRR